MHIFQCKNMLIMTYFSRHLNYFSLHKNHPGDRRGKLNASIAICFILFFVWHQQKNERKKEKKKSEYRLLFDAHCVRFEFGISVCLSTVRLLTFWDVRCALCVCVCAFLLSRFSFFLCSSARDLTLLLRFL